MSFRHWAFGAAASLLLLSALVPRYQGTVETWLARDWWRLPCEIVATDIVPLTDGQTADAYRVEIRYRYQLGEEILRSSEYSFDPPATGSKESLAPLLARYPVGSLTTCAVNPGDVSRAVLDTGYPHPWWELLLAGVAAVGGGAGLGVLFARITGKRRPPRRSAH